jgi:hypothetical protein
LLCKEFVADAQGSSRHLCPENRYRPESSHNLVRPHERAQ